MPLLPAIGTAAILALVGLAVGSLAARAVTLFPPVDATTTAPPPTCPHCRCHLPWPRAVLLPWWLLRSGRCPHCGHALPRPAIVGWGAAVVLAVVGLTSAERGPADVAALAFFGVWATLLAVIDARTRRLPNPLVLPAYPVAVAVVALAGALAPDSTQRLFSAAVGMAGLAAFYWLLWFVNPAGMGWGDVKLSGVVGLYLGWSGLGSLLSGTFVAFLLSACWGVMLIALGRATRKTQIPFGPFMLAGALAILLLGDPLPLLLAGS
ncbi:prepilin peptidase [Salinactinospora qingdaonensis]|uniref:Prepilin leader peptidase/N-methyltransferase n=1 Tax=Salinactinospora qingdaonensis TaxID=702744 RepID=A0ABP7FLM4_9ACTN